jgi:Tol biopolymer transport system component
MLYLPALIVAAVLMACAVVVLALSEKAEATFPGKNGRIAYASYAERCRLCLVGYPGHDPEIYTINPNGRGKFQLTHNNEIDLEPSYSPNGQRIAYASLGADDQEIYTINLNGSGKTKVTNNTKEDDSPAYSPDGKRIAYTTYGEPDSEIYTIKAGGGGRINVTDNGTEDYEPSYSPDGKKIAY